MRDRIDHLTGVLVAAITDDRRAWARAGSTDGVARCGIMLDLLAEIDAIRASSPLPRPAADDSLPLP